MRRFSAFPLLVALALVAAGCAREAAPPPATTPPAATAPSPTVNLQGVELQLMGWASSPAEDEALKALLEKFNAETGARASFNPVPEYDSTLQAALAGGSPPDVFYVDSFKLPDLVDAGALDDAEGKLTNPEDFYPSLLEAFTFEGTLYCPPKDFSTLALVYDVDAFQEAGLQPPTTWDELAAAAEALTTEGRAGLTMGVEYPRWGVFLFQNGTALTDDAVTQVTLDSPQAREALQFVADLYAKGWAVNPPDVDAGWAGEAFGQGKAAMTIEGNWIVSYLQQTFPDKKWAVAELTAGPAGKGTFAFTVCYGVPVNAKNPQASWALVDWLTRPEQALEWTRRFSVMPARQSVRDQWLAEHPELEAFLNGAEYAHKWQFKPGFGDVLGVFNSGIQAVVAGDKTIDQVIQETVDAAQQVLG
jgi:multiple sugar transport system substrate-binding protein